MFLSLIFGIMFAACLVFPFTVLSKSLLRDSAISVFLAIIFLVAFIRASQTGKAEQKAEKEFFQLHPDYAEILGKAEKN